jgi:hypothetical protein
MTTNVPFAQSIPPNAGLSSTVPPIAAATPRTLDDAGLNAWLTTCHKNKDVVTLVYAKHRCAFYNDANHNDLLPADPGNESKKTLQRIAQAGNLRRLEVQEGALQHATQPDSSWATATIVSDKDDIKNWFKARVAVFDTGRGKPLSTAGARRVWHDAAGRCMFRGCGVDLGVTSLTTTSAAAGYLAHIVASDPDGPRGSQADSYRLSDDPGNVMLMCDEHHRLIDRIDPDAFPADVLGEMRREHVSIVQEALKGLALPRSKAMAVLSNIASVWTQASERDVRQAMLDRSLACLPSIRYPLRRTQRDDRDQADFWRHLLHEHALELDAFIRELGSHREHGEPFEVLSVFPLHAVPLLLLTGRIVGEARKVEVFQYHRQRGTWRWDPNAQPQSAGEFYLEGLSDDQAAEVLLSIELTASVDECALPQELQAGVRGKTIPWVRFRSAHPSYACIGHPDDLEQFTILARDVIAVIQDKMRASKVHLIGVSPASTLFRFGQLMQAGHHCPYVVYDRPNHSSPFLPALTINGQQATDAMPIGTGRPTTIQLR